MNSNPRTTALSRWRVPGMVRLQRSWTRWHLNRTQRLIARTLRLAQQILILMDQTQLRLKELQEQEILLSRHLVEQQEIEQFRVTGELPPPPPRNELDDLLGL